MAISMLDHSNPEPQLPQNRDPGGFVRWHRGQAISSLACGEETNPAAGAKAAPGAPGGTFTVTLIGCPHAGIGMPSAAAIPAAWMALNSRTRPGMKKHSTNPRNAVRVVQQNRQ